MSIDAKEFDKHKNPIKYVVEFLRANKDKAFTAEYIAREIGISAYEVREALKWEFVAVILDRAYVSHIERATARGTNYYKYK